MADEHPHINPWIIAISVMLATFMEVLDTSVVNVSLPHIAGSLSATIDEATWTVTSYLVANAIILPMTGWLASAFGRKRLLMLSVVGFTGASFLCGFAPTLGSLIFFRIVQGATGGALQILLDKGQEDDWFESHFMVALAIIAAVLLTVFVIHELLTDDPVVDLRVFKIRSYAVGVFLMTVVGFVLYGSLVLLPIMLQTLLAYPPLQAGIAMAPRGIGSFFMMPITGLMTGKFDANQSAS